MAKVIERLEQKQCELAQPKEKAYLLNDGAGLYLTIQPIWHQASKTNLTKIKPK